MPTYLGPESHIAASELESLAALDFKIAGEFVAIMVAKTNVDKLTAGFSRVSEIINNIFHFISTNRRMLGIFNIAEA